jgi:hypothetical protein
MREDYGAARPDAIASGGGAPRGQNLPPPLAWVKATACSFAYS